MRVQAIESLPVDRAYPPSESQKSEAIAAMVAPLLVKEAIDTLLNRFAQATPSSTIPISIHPSDRFQFGYIWPAIRAIEQQGKFYEIVRERREEIKEQKEHWQDKIQVLYSGADAQFFSAVDKMLQDVSQKQFLRVEEGAGAAIFLRDKQNYPRFVIKAVDEDILCLNNCKLYGSPFIGNKYRVRDHIPLYRSAQTDAVCYQVAKVLTIEEVTPKTVIAIVSSDKFYDLSDMLYGDEKLEFIKEAGSKDKEKLVSVQEYVPHSEDLYAVCERAVGLTDRELTAMFDQGDFEKANIFVWTTYDNDGHAGNYRVYVKGFSAQGKPIYGIKKVDNGLSFPEKNSNFINYLPVLPNGDLPLSPDARKILKEMPVDTICSLLETYEMSSCIEAFKERAEVLKILADRPRLTIYEIDLRMRALCLENGKEIALSDLSRQELEEFLFSEDATYSEVS